MEQLLSTIQQFAKAHNEPQWLIEKRMVAYQMMEDLSAPKLQGLDKDYWMYNAPNMDIDRPLDLTNYASDEMKGQGVIEMDLLSAAYKNPLMLQENLMEKCFVWNHDKFSAQHVAFLQSGAFVFIPSNTVLNEPIDVSKILREQDQEKHVLILVGANSEATIIFSSQYETGQYDRQVTEILVGDNANVRYYDSATTDADQNQKMLFAYLARNAHLNNYVALLNQNDTVYNSKIKLDGEGSEAGMNIVSLSDQAQKQSIYNDITNYQDDTRGIINQRGIVADRAKTHCYTNGRVDQGAKRAYSDQSSRLLTLSSESEGEVDPVLLIRDNDIVAGHAASIGKVDRNQLYYLQSRGISDSLAKYLLTKGFLLPLIQKFPEKKLQDQMIEKLEGRIHEY